MGKFTLGQFMNDHSKTDGGGDALAFKIERIPIENIEPSLLNRYHVDDVAELKASIELIGLEQNLVVRQRETGGAYELISGHRRYKALQELNAEGKAGFGLVPCKIVKSIDDIQTELRLLFGNSTSRRLTDYEITYQAQRIKELLTQLQASGYKIEGRKREIVAELLKVSPSQIARMESINKNLSPELTDEYRKGNINITTAYEASRLPGEQQAEVLADHKSGATLTPDKVKGKRKKPPAAPETGGDDSETVFDANLAAKIIKDSESAEKYIAMAADNAPKAQQTPLPCPFCGHNASVSESYNTRYVVTCDGCLVQTQSYAYMGTAIEAWNRRI